MSKDTKAILVGGLLFAVLVGGFAVYAVKNKNSGPGMYDTFATCLKDAGAKFYGAFWCPHCKNQKALFGSSAKLLPYVECSNPDGRTQNQLCEEQGIKGYPTWVFADGATIAREMTLEELSVQTNCSILGSEPSPTATTTTFSTSTTIKLNQ